jgi:hypothetical protein
VLGGHIEHTGHFAQDWLAAVPVFVTFDNHDAVGLVDREIEPGGLFLPLATELNHSLSVRSIAR